MSDFGLVCPTLIEAKSSKTPFDLLSFGESESSSPACHSASILAKINSSPTQAWQEPISFPTRIQSDFLQTWPVYWTTNSLHPPRSFPELVSVRKDLIIAVSSLEWSVELNFFRIRVWSDSGVSQTVEGILTEENSRLLFFPSWNRR